METNKIYYITIQQYLDGTLDKEAMYELERQALDDPFLADALEGYAHINKPAAKQLSLLQTQLEERIAQQQENKNVFNFSWQRLSIAAAAGLLFVTASILFWIKGQKAEGQLASNPKQVEVNLSPVDSIQAANSDQEQALILPAQPTPEKAVPQKNKEIQIAELKREKVQPRHTAKSEASDAPVSLDEITVVGYGTQKKQDLTGSVATVKSEALQGMLAGVPIVKNISGKVVSNKGEPLPGVSVRLKNSSKSTVSDVNGEFYIDDSKGGELSVAYLGFKTKEVKANAGVPVIVSLAEDENSLSETVVVGYGTKVKGLDEHSEPVIGWSKYKDYLQNSISTLKGDFGSGRVVVAFSVGPDNKLINFQIKRGLDEKSNQEAIRLIKEGPAWIRGKQSEARVTLRFK